MWQSVIDKAQEAVQPLVKELAEHFAAIVREATPTTIEMIPRSEAEARADERRRRAEAKAKAAAAAAEAKARAAAEAAERKAEADARAPRSEVRPCER